MASFIKQLRIHFGWWRERPAFSLFVLALVALAVHLQLFGFHPNNDTEQFIDVIHAFRGVADAPLHLNRYLNPLYPVLSVTLLRGFSPEGVMLVMNVLFYLGTVMLSYGLVRRVFQSQFVGFVSGLFITTAYAMVRYNLTQVWDIGGYFFFALSLYACWRWYNEEPHRDLWLYLGGAAVGFGMLVKESGAMGALFMAWLLLLAPISWARRIRAFLLFSVLPFVTLVSNQLRGHEAGFSSRDWLMYNWDVYRYAYTPIKWAGVNATSFHWLWPVFLIAVFFLIRKWREWPLAVRVYSIAIIAPGISYFAWPIFISRTVFISAWIIIPLVAWQLSRWYAAAKRPIHRGLVIAYIVLVAITPFALQHTLRYARLFDILESCNRNPICFWDTFWENRETYSKIK